MKIKLRVVLKETGELLGHERVNDDGAWENMRVGRESYILGTITSDKEVVRQQFTGLLDSKRDEVYFGDVLASTIDKMLLKWYVTSKNECLGIINVSDNPSPIFFKIDSEYFFYKREIIGDAISMKLKIKNI